MLVIYTGIQVPEQTPQGLDLRHWPLLETQFLDVDRSELIDWTDAAGTALVLYSKNAVRAVQSWPWHPDLVASIQQWWAVGPKTADFAHAQLGVDCHTPETATFDGLVEALREAALPSQMLALSVAGKTRNLDRAVGRRDIDWRDVPVYETRPVTFSDEQRRALVRDADWIAVTSSKGIRALFSQIDPDELRGLRFAAIGPSTAEALKKRGISTDAIPESPGSGRLLRAIANHPSSTPTPPTE